MRSKLSRKQAQIVDELYNAFTDRDYPRCIAQVGALAASAGHSRMGTFLATGLGGLGAKPGEIEQEPSLQAILLLTISYLRVGDRPSAERADTFQQLFDPTGERRKRLVSLIRLLLREVKVDDILASATSSEESLQAHYYEAEGLLTDRNFPAALARFRQCMGFAGKCPEQMFARARAAWLAKDGQLWYLR